MRRLLPIVIAPTTNPLAVVLRVVTAKRAISPTRCWLLLAALWAIPGWASVPQFACARARCGLQGDGTYHHLVLGQIVVIGSGTASERVFRHARSYGWWRALPADAHGFAKYVRPIELRVHTSHGSTLMTLLMGDDEFKTAPLRIGDFVRYSAHDAEHPAPAENTPAAWAYWRLVGCIQVICRVEDSSCRRRYRSGVFDESSGKELDIQTKQVLAGGLVIDPVSYLPKNAVATLSRPH